MPDDEQRSTVVVDDKKCISCGICVSLCPHNALSFQNGLPAVTGKCRVCGLCAASCITKAISMKAKKFTDEGLIEGAGDVKDYIVVFACRRLVEKDKDYGEGVKVISMLCSARFDLSLAAEVFERGAIAVAVVGCEECRNKYGSIEAANKAWLLNEALKLLGEENKVVFDNSIENAVAKLNKDKIKVEPALIKKIALDRNLRAVIAKMRQICEEGNAYGEKISKEEYEEIVKRTLDLAVKVAKVSYYAEGGAKISEIAEKSGLSPEEVMRAVLEMRRRDSVEIEVDEELVVVPR